LNNVRDGLVFVDAVNRGSGGGDERIGLRSGAHDNGKRERSPTSEGWSSKLAERHVDGRRRSERVHAVEFNVRNDADNFTGFVGEEGHRQVFAERVFVGPEALGHGLTDDDDAVGVWRVGIVEFAAAEQRDVQGRKISRRD
jgi:hypothetical protein